MSTNPIDNPHAKTPQGYDVPPAPPPYAGVPYQQAVPPSYASAEPPVAAPPSNYQPVPPGYDQPQQPTYGNPSHQGYMQPMPQQNYQQGQSYPQQFPTVPGYDQSFQNEQSRQNMVGKKYATNALILGLTSALSAFFLWWLLIGILIGVGLGIPAILQGKKAEANNVSGRAGIISGWIGIGISALYVLLLILCGFLSVVSEASAG